MKVAVFAIAAALAAVAGSLLARYISFVGTESFTIEETIYVLAMVILGGTGNLWGSILGAVVLVFLPEALKFVDMPPDVADKMRQVIYGLIRSEEHTSELQSLLRISYAVFCLNNKNTITNYQLVHQ